MRRAEARSARSSSYPAASPGGAIHIRSSGRPTSASSIHSRPSEAARVHVQSIGWLTRALAVAQCTQIQAVVLPVCSSPGRGLLSPPTECSSLLKPLRCQSNLACAAEASSLCTRFSRAQSRARSIDQCWVGTQRFRIVAGERNAIDSQAKLLRAAFGFICSMALAASHAARARWPVRSPRCRSGPIAEQIEKRIVRQAGLLSSIVLPQRAQHSAVVSSSPAWPQP